MAPMGAFLGSFKAQGNAAKIVCCHEAPHKKRILSRKDAIGRGCLPVNFAAVAHADNEDADEFVFNTGDDAVIADPVLPKVAQVRALQSLADAARVLKTCDSLEENLADPSCDLRIEGF